MKSMKHWSTGNSIRNKGKSLIEMIQVASQEDSDMVHRLGRDDKDSAGVKRSQNRER